MEINQDSGNLNHGGSLIKHKKDRKGTNELNQAEAAVNQTLKKERAKGDPTYSKIGNGYKAASRSNSVLEVTSLIKFLQSPIS